MTSRLKSPDQPGTNFCRICHGEMLLIFDESPDCHLTCLEKTSPENLYNPNSIIPQICIICGQKIYISYKEHPDRHATCIDNSVYLQDQEKMIGDTEPTNRSTRVENSKNFMAQDSKLKFSGNSKNTSSFNSENIGTNSVNNFNTSNSKNTTSFNRDNTSFNNENI